MFFVRDGIASADEFRNNDWLNCLSFDLLARDALLEHGQFPLRSHLVGGGFPIIAHPSDGSWALTLLTVLLLGPVIGLKINLLLFFLAGVAGTYLLARRWLELSVTASLYSALLFGFSGWAPCMMLVGFYNQIFFLLTPLLLYLLAGTPSRTKLLWAGLLLCLVLQQGGHAFAAISHFLGLYAWVAAASLVKTERSSAWVRWLAPMVVMILMTFPLALAKELEQFWIMLLGVGVVAIWCWRSAARREHLRLLAPRASALGLVLMIALSLGAAKVVGYVYLAKDAKYGMEPRRYGLWFENDKPPLAWVERYYEDPGALWSGLTGRVAPHGEYDGEESENSDYEYAFLGLTWAPLLLALFGVWRARRCRRSAVMTVLLLFYLLISCGWFLPPDFHFLYIWGLPWLGGLGQPIKYFNFFILLFLVLLAGGGVQAIIYRLPTGRARSLAGAVAIATLAIPFAQNWPVMGEVFSTPRPAPAKEPFHQVALVGSREWVPRGEEWIQQRSAEKFLRDKRRPKAATEYYNIRRGVGTVDWYGSVILVEYAIPNRYLTLQGEVIPNPRNRGDAWIMSGKGMVHSLAVKPNTIDLDVDLPRKDRVVINQNHLKGFTSSTGALANQKGLLAVDLPAGRHQVRLTYRPWFFIAGLGVSGAAFLAWLVALVLLRRRWPRGSDPA